jgi:transposase-like protein
MNRRQTIPKELRYTREQFDREFPNDDVCLEAIKEQRFPGGVKFCDTCRKSRRHYRVTGRTAYACDRCGNHVYPLAGTIFEKSSTSLRVWFQAMYLMGSTRCGISAKQIQRETGVTYKTAWRMFHQIRKLLSEDFPIGGASGPGVEMDEAWIGGRERHSPIGDTKKACVVGMVERKGGRVKAVIADDNSRLTLHTIAKEYILPKSTVFTDDLAGYHGLKNHFDHQRINHSQGVYVMGNVHTNTIEGFWGLVKRGIGGVYHSVSAKYLQGYLDEYSFRYNRRDSGNLIFVSILQRVGEMASRKPAAEEPKTVTS